MKKYPGLVVRHFIRKEFSDYIITANIGGRVWGQVGHARTPEFFTCYGLIRVELISLVNLSYKAED